MLTKFLRAIEDGIFWCVDFCVFLFLRVVLIECTLKEVRLRTYGADGPVWPELDATTLRSAAGSELSRHTIDSYATAAETGTKARNANIGEKLRALLGASSLVFGLIGGLAPEGSRFVPLTLLLLSVSAVLTLCALAASKFATLSLDRHELSRPADEAWAIAIQGRLDAAGTNANAVAFVVDCFRASQRYFVLALFSVLLVPAYPAPVVAPAAVPTLSPPETGPPGPRGSRGPRGRRGAPGPSGACSCTTESTQFELPIGPPPPRRETLK